MSKSKNTIFVTLLCLYIFTALLFIGCSDNWVEVGGTQDYIIYYKPSSVKIDKDNKTILVLTKYVYTEKGIMFAKKMFAPFIQDKDYYDKFAYSLDLYLFNYKDWEFAIIQNTAYSKSDGILFNKDNIPQWQKIDNTNISLILINTLIREYDIKM
jgi:hypothetical protein